MGAQLPKSDTTIYFANYSVRYSEALLQPLGGRYKVVCPNQRSGEFIFQIELEIVSTSERRVTNTT